MSINDSPQTSQRRTALDVMRDEARSKGHVYVRGEMEFDVNQGAAAAFHAACEIAEACGYSVQWRARGVAFSVNGPNILGEYVFDWKSPQVRNLQQIDYWSAQAVYTDLPRRGPVDSQAEPPVTCKSAELVLMRTTVRETGRVNFYGELAFDVNRGPSAAYYDALSRAENLASPCQVKWRYGNSAFSIVFGTLEHIFDWFDPETHNLQKIELWTCRTVTTDLPQQQGDLTPGAQLEPGDIRLSVAV